MTPTGSLTMARRKAAAEFIKDCTSEDIPYSNDLHFRQSLCDGRLLCKVLNTVYANAVPKVTPLAPPQPVDSSFTLHSLYRRLRVGTRRRTLT